MDNERIKKLLYNNGNFMSNYGGLVALFIIVLLIVGITIIKIPYKKKLLLEKENTYLTGKIYEKGLQFQVGDTLLVSNSDKKKFKLVIINIIKFETFLNIQFTTTKNELNSFTNSDDYFVLLDERSLLSSFIKPFIERSDD